MTCAKEMSRPPQGAYMACKQSHLSRNHGAKTVLCLGDSFPFHLHSIHLSKFTRIYPFFFPLSTFPKFTRNFGGSTAREEGALHSEQKCEQLPSEVLTTALGDQPIEEQDQKAISKNRDRPEFFDVDPPDVLVPSPEVKVTNSPNLSRDEPTQISLYLVE